MTLVRALGAGLAAALLACADAAAEHAFGPLRLDSAVFAVTQENDEVAGLSDGRGGAVIVLKPRARPGGTREQVFQALADATAPGGDWDSPKTALTAGGYEVLYASDFVRASGARIYMVPVTVFAGDQVAMLTLVDVDDAGKQPLQERFGDLLASVRFTTAAPAAGPGGATGGLEGFYAGIGARTGLDALAQIAVEVGAKGLWLRPDGRFVLTESGMAGSVDDHCARLPRDCGRYAVRGGELVRWRVATKQQEYLRLMSRTADPLNRDGDDLIIGETRYRHVPPADDLTLLGQYRRVRAGARQTIGGGTDIAFNETVYGFARDGRFFEGGYVANFSDGGGVASGVWGDRTRKQGRYTIDGYTLTLAYEGGPTERKAFFLMDHVPVINGDMYEKVD